MNMTFARHPARYTQRRTLLVVSDVQRMFHCKFTVISVIIYGWVIDFFLTKYLAAENCWKFNLARSE
jgi:hypothetical protein